MIDVKEYKSFVGIDSFYNCMAPEVIDFCEAREITYHIKTITDISLYLGTRRGNK